MSPILFEACVDSLDKALEAADAGAGRLELCSHLEVQGLTPDASLLRTVCARVRIPVHVMIRLREGDFTASEAELLVMESQIDLAARLGASGVVFGVVREGGEVDVRSVRRLVASAGKLSTTFHRAFDGVPDRRAALDALLETGVHRVLTSGGAPTAYEGRFAIRELVLQAADRICIIAGGGVRPANWEELVRDSGVTEIHGTVPIRTGAPPS